ncbi:DUF6504 family protein [Mobilicoccus caccae]|uniref:DUF6504 domain-containing protein n=1 Tax=Mobilicoccus caccae TaxID=1859295 RepID=A0ABQ6IPG4_9MICO|nr:DUF6504 family protein [Mobilicoccus caccae]GMA39803.1 hypothetical protein GCM10025883_18480 [Mobilicoccus caccae]
MRRYDEPVQVQTDQEESPHRFLWHGRVYDIEAVLDRWVIRLPWWRRALAPDGGAWALEPDLLDEHVWRVSAVARGARAAGAGIYDLSRGRQWRLLRVGD